MAIKDNKTYFVVPLVENLKFNAIGHTITNGLREGYKVWYKGKLLSGWDSGKPSFA